MFLPLGWRGSSQVAVVVVVRWAMGRTPARAPAAYREARQAERTAPMAQTGLREDRVSEEAGAGKASTRVQRVLRELLGLVLLGLGVAGSAVAAATAMEAEAEVGIRAEVGASHRAEAEAVVLTFWAPRPIRNQQWDSTPRAC